ncbi:MAG: carbohydrate-binding protein, partial [Bacteroides sp.]|nr:carbohydrate-binding protein [Bacteroides sp.]
MRSVCLDRFRHNEDGSIQPTVPTRNGLPQLKYVDAYRRNEAETMAEGHGIDTAFKDEHRQNRVVTSIHDGDYIRISGVDFGSTGASRFSASLASSFAGGRIELRLESASGLLIGTLPVQSTGGLSAWETMTTAVKPMSGVYDLYLVFKGEGEDELFRMDYWQFK